MNRLPAGVRGFYFLTKRRSVDNRKERKSLKNFKKSQLVTFKASRTIQTVETTCFHQTFKTSASRLSVLLFLLKIVMASAFLGVTR